MINLLSSVYLILHLVTTEASYNYARPSYLNSLPSQRDLSAQPYSFSSPEAFPSYPASRPHTQPHFAQQNYGGMPITSAAAYPPYQSAPNYGYSPYGSTQSYVSSAAPAYGQYDYGYKQYAPQVIVKRVKVPVPLPIPSPVPVLVPAPVPVPAPAPPPVPLPIPAPQVFVSAPAAAPMSTRFAHYPNTPITILQSQFERNNLGDPEYRKEYSEASEELGNEIV
ncbi:nematocyst expressed protein 4-like [Artemia franciscana]|uniref:Uncharacterized protein n=1 Tax=Artemia franciscana TaxID=6661 RepID=A0AA88I6Z0_ARTSF|nr:hypothetical protein QYM36_002889 [Artemia franciscana]